jgi:hypothetical protein
MRTARIVTNVQCRPRSIVDLLTKDFIRLKDSADLSSPYSLSFPIPAGKNGLTIAFYTRQASGNFEGYYPILEGNNGLDGGFGGSQFVYGIFQNGGLWVEGANFGYGPRYLYSFRRFVPVVVRTAPSATYGAGRIFLNSQASGGIPRSNLLGDVDLAFIVVYYRCLTDAELAAPMLPADYDQQYTLDTYAAGDATLIEKMGTGLDALFIY